MRNHMKIGKWRTALLICGIFIAGPAAAEPKLTLELPIDCRIGDDCWLVNFVDRDPGPGRIDFRCGDLSYNTHKGTDIALANIAQMRRGVAVLAAAPGRVVGIRDGMGETAKTTSSADLKGRDCGNGIMIEHEDGWSTQYCHMKAGSLAVVEGSNVRRGQRIGEVGLSGRTEFPHIHITVRKGNTVIDPFTGESQISACDKTSKMDGLWSDSARKNLAYPGPQPFNIGFDDSVPKVENVRAGLLNENTFSLDAAAFVFWAESYSLLAGDDVRLTLRGPDGNAVSDNRIQIEKTLARYFRFVGRKKPTDGWPVGTYTGEIAVTQDGVTVTKRARAEIR